MATTAVYQHIIKGPYDYASELWNAKAPVSTRPTPQGQPATPIRENWGPYLGRMFGYVAAPLIIGSPLLAPLALSVALSYLAPAFYQLSLAYLSAGLSTVGLGVVAAKVPALLLTTVAGTALLASLFGLAVGIEKIGRAVFSKKASSAKDASQNNEEDGQKASTENAASSSPPAPAK